MASFWKRIRSMRNTTNPNPSVSTLKGRQLVAQDTLDVTPEIIAEHAIEGATDDSTFYSDQLPPLEAIAHKNNKSNDDSRGNRVKIINSDSFTAARQLISKHPQALGSTAVLNLASDVHPAGGWLESLSRTQEEALCYSSTLYTTLKESYYPWSNLGPGSAAGVYSPGVVVFKHDLDHDCIPLSKEQRKVVSVITVAAPRWPTLSEDGERFSNESDLKDLREKIKLVYRMAGHHGQRYVILGAMGCGAYACPPRLVAEEMKAVLLDNEFRGYFDKVVFAVYSKDGDGNFAVFEDVFRNVYI